MNSFALKPGGKVFFQDQHRFPRFVCRKIPFLDGTVDRVITAMCQFSRFRYGKMRQFFCHCPYLSSIADLISADIAPTEANPLMLVVSSRLNPARRNNHDLLKKNLAKYCDPGFIGKSCSLLCQFMFWLPVAKLD
jgi:hypothetical protein